MIAVRSNNLNLSLAAYSPALRSTNSIGKWGTKSAIGPSASEQHLFHATTEAMQHHH